MGRLGFCAMERDCSPRSEQNVALSKPKLGILLQPSSAADSLNPMLLRGTANWCSPSHSLRAMRAPAMRTSELGARPPGVGAATGSEPA